MNGDNSMERTGAKERLDPAECLERLKFETLLVDLSAQFIHLPAKQVEAEIEKAQRRICECLGLDLAALWQWEAGAPDVFTLTHLYRRTEEPPITRQLDGAQPVPWARREILAGRCVLVSSLDDVPERAGREVESWRSFGLKNALICPLAVGGTAPFGALSFHDMVVPRTWSDAMVHRLELVARIIANALARRRYEETLRESEERLKLATEAAEAAPWVLDVQKACFWVGGRIREMFGLPPGDRLALEDFLGLVHPDDRPAIRRTIEGALQSRELAVVEYRIVCPDGQVRWMLSRGRASAREAGGKPRFMGVTVDITARKEGEKVLRESGARMAAAMDVAELGFYEVANGDRVAFLDHRARDIIGASPADEEAGRIFEFWGAHVHPDDLLRVMELNRALNEGERERLTLDYRFLNPERGVIHVHHLVHVIERDAAGHAVRTIGVLQDVTGRRETEKALHESRARMAAALDVAELGFYEVLNNVRVTFVDRRARDILGATEADEQAGRILEFWMERLHPEDVPGVMEVRRLMEETGRDRMTVDYRFLNPARGVIHVHHLVHVLERDAAGLAVRTIGVLQDVTESRQKEEALRAQQAHLASAIEAAGLGFYEMGANGRTRVMDDYLRALIGISGEEDEAFVRDFWLAHVHPEDLPRVLRKSRDLLEGTADRVAAEYRYRHPTRGELWFHQLSRALERDAAGRAVRTVGVIQDVTERKAVELEARRTQNELAHATRMSVLGELAASMAHELNQPLAAILSNAQAARRFLAAPEPDMQEIREILDDIVRDDKRAGDVIHHMRAMIQKKGAVAAEPLDFNKLVGDTAKLVHSEMVGRNVGLELDLAPELPAILAGRVEMQQVLLNLMVNAMDAMRDQPAERRQLRIQTSAADGRVRVALRDRGHGIPENAMADIFRPFFTTKTQGLGMGLSISRSMVEAHGGKLWAENAPDGGAIFWIEMPVCSAESAS